jgi:hypothetical protein
MATELHPTVEGQTEPIVHQLLSDGVPFPIFGLLITLILQKKDGTAVDTSTKVTILDDGVTPALVGKLQLEPDVADFVKSGSEYYWRWKVVDGDGKIAFWPGGEAARIKVFPVAHP